MTNPRMADRFRKRQIIFAFLFLLGSLIAPIGWYADWNQLDPIDDYSTIIIIIGHGLQVIGAFGSLVTPDYAEGEEE
jgi:hypothetical protein